VGAEPALDPRGGRTRPRDCDLRHCVVVTDRVRLLTFNLLTLDSASGHERHEVVRRLMPELRPDIVALQEVTRRADLDQASDVLGPEFEIVDLPGWTPHHVGECLASRWPLGEVATLDRHLIEDAEDGPRAAAVAVEVLVPPPLGRMLVVHHKAAYQLQLEHVREEQALATARLVEDLVSERRDVPVVLLGDLNAGPDAASIRFLTGRQAVSRGHQRALRGRLGSGARRRASLGTRSTRATRS
jgi:endonuclease/exonuclease/phosphatase family metal-dependent hydrolase